MRGEFFSLREEYQLYKDYRVWIEEVIKSEVVCWLSVGYALRNDICNLFADFIQRTYADDVWVPSDPGPDLVQDDLPFGAPQFIVDEVQIVLLELDVSKNASPDGIPLLILNNCVSTFSSFSDDLRCYGPNKQVSILFNRSLSPCVLLDRWKLSYVTPLFNNVEDYRGNCCFIELCTTDLKNLISVNQHGFMKT
jgi:hypothetical protein